MIKQLLKTLMVMAVLLSLVAVPAMAATKNGPLIVTGGGGVIETLDPTTGQFTNIPGAISDPSVDSSPSVTPDGNIVVYSGNVGARYVELFSVPLDGSAAPTQLTSTAGEFSASFK